MCIASVLYENYHFLQTLSFTGQQISNCGIRILAAGLRDNRTLRNLCLTSCGLNDADSMYELTRILQNNLSLEHLDLSDNKLDDEAVSGFPELIETNYTIKYLALDHNDIKDCSFSLSLEKNESLEHFSISFNPLRFDNFIGMLEALVNNKTLKHLGIQGVEYEGPAPIKENVSGHLMSSEAIILKLANVFRYSSITSIAIDFDVEADVQLADMENSLIKRNRSLQTLQCKDIDWKKLKGTGPLIGIQRALRANQWLAQNENLPTDRQGALLPELKEIIDIKKEFIKRQASENSVSDSEILRYSLPRFPSENRQINIEAAENANIPESAETPQFTSFNRVTKFPFEKNGFTVEEEEDIIFRSYGNSEEPSYRKNFETPSDEENSLFSNIPLEASNVFQVMETPDESRTRIRHQNFSLGPNPKLSPFADKYRGYEHGDNIANSLQSIVSSIQGLQNIMTSGFSRIEDRVCKIEDRVNKQTRDISVFNDFTHNMKEQLTSNNKRVQDLEKEVRDYYANCKKYYLDVETRISTLEHKDHAKVTLFEEFGDEIDGLRESVIEISEKLETLNSTTSIQIKADNELKVLNDKLTNLERDISAFNKDLYNLQTSLENTQREMMSSKKMEDTLIELKQHSISELANIDERISLLESGEERIKDVFKFTKNLENHFNQKLAKLENKLKGEKTYDIESKLKSLEERHNKLFINIENSLAEQASLQSNHIEQRLSKLESQQLELKNTKGYISDCTNTGNSRTSQALRLSDLDKPVLQTAEDFMQSSCEVTPTRERIRAQTPQNKLYNKLPSQRLKENRTNLNERILHMERSSQKKPVELRDKSSPPDFKDSKHIRLIDDYLPGDAESLVLNAIMYKANTQKAQDVQKLSFERNYRALSPVSGSFSSIAEHSNRISPLKESIYPSPELLEYLRLRGFSIKDNRPVMRRPS